MDIFKLTRSAARQKILTLFLANPGEAHYLHEIAGKLSISAGNVRREMKTLASSGLFDTYRLGRLLYFKINQNTALFETIKTLTMKTASKTNDDIIARAFLWVTKPSPITLQSEIYCQTRDIFQVRLQTFTEHLEAKMGTGAYLVSAVGGEIGNNSFDHNQGNWPDMPGILFAHTKKTVVLADRGQGVLKTLQNVRPQIKNDRQALKIAFTEVISGRFGEKRGNGLKFVSSIVSDNKWLLEFRSGKAILRLSGGGKMKIIPSSKTIKGCMAVLKY